jgi:hypothetical protein
MTEMSTEQPTPPDAIDDQQQPPADQPPAGQSSGRQRPKPRSRKLSTTAQIATALERKYPFEKSAYAILYEVGNSTGFGCNRHCDALVMSLWPSRGIWLAGFEFKASRSDWLKEYADPAKADSIQRYCDYWWLAVTDASIVKDEELPENWGLMALNSRGSLEVIKPAPKLTPVEMDRHMLAAIMRRVTEPIVNVAESELNKRRWEGVQEGERRRDREVKQLTDERDELRKIISDFEKASGIELQTYRYRFGGITPDQLGNAVRMVAEGRLSANIDEIKRLRDRLTVLANGVSDLIEVAKHGPDALKFDNAVD